MLPCRGGVSHNEAESAAPSDLAAGTRVLAEVMLALLLAAAVTLTVNPRAIEDVGWQLSFVAVMAILLMATRLRDGLDLKRFDHAMLSPMATISNARSWCQQAH